MKKVLTVVLLVAAFCSCKKSSNSTSTPTNTDTLATKSFEQLTPGAYWKFAFRTGTDSLHATADTVKLTVLNADSIVNVNGINLSYKVISDSTKSYNFLYRSVADSEYRRGLFTKLIGYGIPDIEEKYFIESSSVGTSWSMPIPFTGSLAFLKGVTNNYQLMSLNDSLAVAGKTYQHVAHVHLDILMNATTVIGVGDFYYARGYGSIKYALNVSFSGFISFYQSQVLLDSQIK